MALPYDSAAKSQGYSHPEVLVSTEWLAEHLDDPGLVVAESDEDVLLYETGGFPHVRNYDGSWTEWGNSVRVPIKRGETP